MKFRINICHIYLFVILLCSLNGMLYSSSGFIAIILQYALILLSFYYAFYANLKYNLPIYFKALNVLLVLFTIYGMSLLISGEHLTIWLSFIEIPNTEYLKSIYKSLLPVYPFYVFTKHGLLKEKTVKFWFIIFLLLAYSSYSRTQEWMLAAAIERGSSSTEFTNNTGYVFLGLLPALVLFYKKPIIQYLGLVICAYFIVMSMKRGAILCGIICFAWFIITNLKKSSSKKKWITVIVTMIAVLLSINLFNHLMETSTYFRYRISMTKAGDSSGRDALYKFFYDQIIQEDNVVRFLFGYGANGTLKIGGEYAHNDWLEIAINQGLFGIVIFLGYWICFYISWRKTKWHPQAFMAIGMVFFIYFLSTFFSMSYNSVTKCAAMVLGYYLAIGFETTSQEKKFVQLFQKEPLAEM